jgi:hypothetical protein
MEQLLDVVAYVAKACDDDGMELYFVHNQSHVKSPNATGLVEAVQKVNPSKGCAIGSAVDKVLNEYKERLHTRGTRKSKVQRAILYIFTAGCWAQHDALKQTIERFARYLDHEGLVLDQFGIQFILFGEDHDTEEILDDLDHLDGVR